MPFISTYSTQGGDDALTCHQLKRFPSNSQLVGDADYMSDTARGGNDTLTANNFGGSSYVQLCGDAGQSMMDSTQGGNDTLTAIDLQVTLRMHSSSAMLRPWPVVLTVGMTSSTVGRAKIRSTAMPSFTTPPPQARSPAALTP